MKTVIIINGLIASGKNTLGKLLVDRYTRKGINSKFYDIDREVTRLNPKNYWKDDQSKINTWLAARKNYALAANIDDENIIIIAGPFFTKDEIESYVSYLDEKIEIFLFILNTPLDVRIKRNKHRTPSNDPKDIIDQERKFQSIKNSLYGKIIDNSLGTETTLDKIMMLIKKNQGIIKKKEFR